MSYVGMYVFKDTIMVKKIKHEKYICFSNREWWVEAEGTHLLNSNVKGRLQKFLITSNEENQAHQEELDLG